MTERPILFSAPMVRAILDGTKTQTRRVVRVPAGWEIDDQTFNGKKQSVWISQPRLAKREYEADMKALRWVTYAEPGDRLWVRETWNLARPLRNSEGVVDDEQFWTRRLPKQDPRGKRMFDDWCLGYAADGGEPPWRPSIFMPRWASRIKLEVTGVRFERLQEIKEADARAEGVSPLEQPVLINGKAGRAVFFDVRRGFAALWESINGKRPGCSWADNPLVWCVSFRRMEP